MTTIAVIFTMGLVAAALLGIAKAFIGMVKVFK